MKKVIEIAVLAVLAFAGLCWAGPTFQGIGDLPGGNTSSAIYGGSPDGQWMCGYSYGPADRQGIRWSLSGGIEPLHLPSDVYSTCAYGINDSGNAVGWRNPGGPSWTAVYWGPSGSMIDLSDHLTAQGCEIYNWDLEIGAWISNAENHYAGQGRGPTWREGWVVDYVSPIVGIGEAPGGTASSSIYGGSPNGEWFAGWASTSEGTQAIRWSLSTGIEVLHDSLGPAHGYGINDCGVTVGYIRVGGADYIATYWGNDLQPHGLQNYLLNHGVPCAGWSLSAGTWISNDGLSYAGWGINPDGQTEGWLATIPEPSSMALLVVGVFTLLRKAKR